MSMPRFSFMKTAVSRIEINAPRLQQRGPPIFPISQSIRDVSIIQRPQLSLLRGVVFVIMLIKIPALSAAPHIPQKPHVPPGTLLPLESISLNDDSRVMAFESSFVFSSAKQVVKGELVALKYADRSAAPTRT